MFLTPTCEACWIVSAKEQTANSDDFLQSCKSGLRTSLSDKPHDIRERSAQ
jgi:hypothetical protein